MSDEGHKFSAHCAANGCPCQAVMSRGTGGGSEFWCPYHFGQDPHRMHEITAELVRLKWLVQLCKCIRDYLNTGIWTELHQQAFKQISLNQRSDLLMLPSTPDRLPESHPKWLARLEQVLADATKAPPAAKPQQETIDV